MKLKLAVSDERYDELKDFFTTLGVEIDDDAELVLTEQTCYAGHIPVRRENGDRVRIAVGEIVLAESFGHEIVIRCNGGAYRSADSLSQLEKSLDPALFLRVSSSAIVARKKIKFIKPALSSKFILTMTNGSLVTVTRSYYNIFREQFGI
ncbi:MAG: LytTR family DNA-binding domain-containing protein [Oscillospiraceae bacterium]